MPAGMVKWLWRSNKRVALCITYDKAYAKEYDTVFLSAKWIAHSWLNFSGKVYGHMSTDYMPGHWYEISGPSWVEHSDKALVYGQLQDGTFEGLFALGCAWKQEQRAKALCLAFFLTAAVECRWTADYISWPAVIPLLRAAWEGLNSIAHLSPEPWRMQPKNMEQAPSCTAAQTCLSPVRDEDRTDLDKLHEELDRLGTPVKVDLPAKPQKQLPRPLKLPEDGAAALGIEDAIRVLVSTASTEKGLADQLGRNCIDLYKCLAEEVKRRQLAEGEVKTLRDTLTEEVKQRQRAEWELKTLRDFVIASMPAESNAHG